MKKVALSVLAAALLASAPAFAGAYSTPAVVFDGDDEQPEPSQGGPNGCGDGFRPEAGLCVPE